MADGEDMVEVHFQERIVLRSIDLLAMLLDGFRRILLPMVSVKEPWFK
ncbi:UNVERIFIED_CONTAM: hypothetical protein GTU68_035826 [Idotea baltica]|nr:hypothetical protein [Idotea baltica]